MAREWQAHIHGHSVVVTDDGRLYVDCEIYDRTDFSQHSFILWWRTLLRTTVTRSGGSIANVEAQGRSAVIGPGHFRFLVDGEVVPAIRRQSWIGRQLGRLISLCAIVIGGFFGIGCLIGIARAILSEL